MNCFSEDLIQKYVDGETTNDETSMIESHMKECFNCKMNIAHQKQRSIQIKMVLNRLIDDIPEKPKIPMIINKNRQHYSLKRKLIYGMTAACILGILVFVIGHQHTTNKNDMILYHNLDFEVDANKPITDQEIHIYVVDQDGNETGLEFN